MKISKIEFLARYYAANLTQVRLGGRIESLLFHRYGRKWEGLRRQCEGHDSWLVVGNGPSLCAKDLTSLQSIPAVASNKINLIYEQTRWRPTLYTIGDPVLLYKLPSAHYNNHPLVLAPHVNIRLARTKNKLPWRSVEFNEARKVFENNGALPSPLSGVFMGRTITVPNIQLAMWCGAKTVYVIGCDHFYKEASQADRSRLAHGDISNHFHPDYRKAGEFVNAAPIELMNQGYELVRKIADRNGVRIINISRQTALTAFEISSVEDVLENIDSSVP